MTSTSSTVPTAGAPAAELRVIDLRGGGLSDAQLRAVVPRQSGDFVHSAEEAVAGILEDVRLRGPEALRELAARFDGVEQERLRVPPEAIAEAVAGLDPEVRRGLETAIARTRAFAEAQRPQDSSIEVAPGARLSNRWTPMRRSGLYVPGGLAVYPSSVVMNVVPAQAAGVESVVLCTPPQREFGGLPHSTTLAAAGLLGVDEVWAIGGAQALGAMTYGVEDGGDVLEPVDILTGPGNIYVAMAKRQLRARVGVDGEAGTTEIAVVADDSARPDFVAADLISQAEHDPHAGSLLITHSQETADAVAAAVAEQAAATPHRERVATALSGEQSGIILTDDLAESIRVADAYAAEHLEIHTHDAAGVAARIRNAGAIFLGPYSPVPLGDYAAGSNHVLPTGGSAAYTGGLSTATFLKAVQIVDYTAEALAEVGDAVVALAHAEDLPAHGAAITVRGGSGPKERS
ncbi:histidinol dehydrogenase [Rothia sp. AR01]|uniref:Histidinol dehydrogenase n=1 Tax=Rothia santali TaxID=2949643 RepID=A0A9X2HEX2_9MICC|nr:histidinol dehydrogenase [Rothia santali]MCP3425537.1 histidinol dehydrogenase [Rothia santali]